MLTAEKTTRLSNLHVQTLEQEIALIREWEADYQQNWWMPMQKAYAEGLEYINNLTL